MRGENGSNKGRKKVRKQEGTRGKEGGGFSEGERGRGRSVRDEQKPAPSCRLAADAQEHVSAARRRPQPGLQDP